MPERNMKLTDIFIPHYMSLLFPYWLSNARLSEIGKRWLFNKHIHCKLKKEKEMLLTSTYILPQDFAEQIT